MPNPICHFELLVPDPEKAKSFYGEVFDWEFESMPGSDYQLIQTGAPPCGGLMKKPEEMPVNAALQVYVLVDSVEETLGKAEGAGAKVVVPKTEVPNVGHFAVFQDPEGIVLGSFEAVKTPSEAGETAIAENETAIAEDEPAIPEDEPAIAEDEGSGKENA